MKDLDLDYCPECDFPTFGHERVVLIQGEFLHQHCLDGSLFVAKMSDLSTKYDQTN